MTASDERPGRVHLRARLGRIGETMATCRAHSSPFGVLLAGIVAAAVALVPPAHGQRRGMVMDQQIVDEARPVSSSGRVDVFQHGIGVDSRLAEAAERALARMEELLGRKLDEATLGPRVRVYVSADTAVSHVWRGYAHPDDPKAILFLNPLAARLAMSGTNATYAHELAHLLTWRYYSHTLREGLADFLALQLHPRAGVGPNSEGYASPRTVPPEILEYLGTSRPPPGEVSTNIQFRRAYYYASYRFVRYLIERAGMATFLKLYDAKEPGAEYVRLYGAELGELVAGSTR